MSVEKKEEKNKLYMYITILVLKVVNKQTHNPVYSLLSSLLMIILGSYILYTYVNSKKIKVGDDFKPHVENHEVTHALLYIVFGAILLFYDLTAFKNCK